jgi:predicted AlkP superfamily phosphohydrolase/phosphomutase
MKKSDRRTLIFGIDGGTWEILDPLLSRGVMPTLRRLKEQGAWGRLQSVVPVNSAAAWSSFLTGLPPEKHGVLDFFAWKSGTAKRTTVNATWLPHPTILDLLQEEGPILSLKVPMTYPPWTIRGAMVSGLPTPDDESAFTFPQDLAGRINALTAKKSAGRDWELQDSGRDLILNQLDAAQDNLERTTDLLISEYPDARIAFVVARDVDELQHFFWDALTASPHEEASIYLPRLERYFSRLDDYLGRWLVWAGTNARVVLLSDHGFGPVEGIWHLNEWLKLKGFLRVRDDAQTYAKEEGFTLSRRLNYAVRRRLLRAGKRLHFPCKGLEKSLEGIKFKSLHQADLGGVDWSETLAYAGNVGEEFLPLYINLQGREPFGIVSPQQYAKVREDLRMTLMNNRLPAVKTVHRAEDLFGIADARQAATPDLIVETVSGGVQSDFSLGASQAYEPSRYRKACHRRQGMFLLSGPEVDSGRYDADLLDIPATILAWQGVPVPEYFGGNILDHILAELPGRKKEAGAGLSSEPVVKREYLSDEDEAGARAKLESLGYL